MNKACLFDNLRRSDLHSKLTKSQVEGYEALIDQWQREVPALSIEQFAYVLATAYHETGGRMEPVREGFAKTDAGAVAAVTKLFKSGRISRNYALPDKRTGKSYYGRGLAQVTHYDNYTKVGKAIGVDLVNNPDLLLDLEVSVKALMVGMRTGLFTGKKLSDYIAPTKMDFRGARRIINGTDRAEHIAEIAEKFVMALQGAMA